jgi:hypothetical protein
VRAWHEHGFDVSGITTCAAACEHYGSPSEASQAASARNLRRAAQGNGNGAH